MNKPTPGQLASMERHKSFHAAIAARAVLERETPQARPRGIKGWDVPVPKAVEPVEPDAPRFKAGLVPIKIPELPIARIIRIVAKEYGVTTIDIMSARRTKDVVMPRQISMFLAKYTTLSSFPKIGRRFGNRDHTTAMHAVRKIGAMIERDAGFAAEIQRMRILLSGGAVPEPQPDYCGA